jgi:TRAP-type C4-dicarboxylate transport system substrate-binding protein
MTEKSGLGQAYKHLTEEVEQRLPGWFEFEFFWASSLVHSKDMEACGAGLTDLLFNIYPYRPEVYTLSTVEEILPFKPTRLQDVAKIRHQMWEEFPEMKDETEHFGQKIIYATVLPTYDVNSIMPLRTLDDFKGKKIGAVGANFPKYCNAIGGTGVTVTVGDRYDQLNNKTIDASILSVDNMADYAHYEVAKYLTIVGFGAYCPGDVGMNFNLFNSFSPEVQQAWLDAGRATEEWEWRNVEALVERCYNTMEENGVEIIELSEADRVEWANALKDFPAAWVQEGEAKGKPTREVLERYIEICEGLGLEWATEWQY